MTIEKYIRCHVTLKKRFVLQVDCYLHRYLMVDVCERLISLQRWSLREKKLFLFSGQCLHWRNAAWMRQTTKSKLAVYQLAFIHSSGRLNGYLTSIKLINKYMHIEKQTDTHEADHNPNSDSNLTE